MPNKTIYVADGDLPIFERAQELARENLSATIAQALRRFVAAEEARSQGFGEIVLRVGNHGTYTSKAFIGRELAKRREREVESHTIVTQNVYETAKGRLVLYTRTIPDWYAWQSYWEEDEQGQRPDRPNKPKHDVDVDVDVDVDLGGNETDATTRRLVRRQEKEQWRNALRQQQERRHNARSQQQEQWRNWTWGWSSWRADVVGNEYRMEIFETLDDLKPHIADELYNAVAQTLKGEDVEFLDI
jgi:EXLDI family protein